MSSKVVIWKYNIEIEDDVRVLVPLGAEYLHFGLDPEGIPSIWVKIPLPIQERKDSLRFRIVGTGNAFDHTSYEYRSSINHGRFIWHLLERV